MIGLYMYSFSKFRGITFLKQIKMAYPLLLLSGVLVACGAKGVAQGTSSSTTAGSTQKFGTLSIGSGGDPQSAAQMIVAIDQGYCAAKGITITPQYFSIGAGAVQALAAGSLNVLLPGIVPSSSYVGSAISPQSGRTLKLLAPLDDIAGSQALVVNPTIKTPKDLEGKSICIAFGSGATYFWNRFYTKYGIDPSKVTVVNLSGQNGLTALVQGHLDAVMLFQPFVLKAQNLGMKVLATGKYTYFNGVKTPANIFDDYVVLAASQAWVSGNPKEAQDLTGCFAQANEYIKQHPNNTAKLVAAGLQQPLEAVTVAMSENDYTMNINQTFVNNVNIETSFLHQIGVVKKSIVLSDWLDDTPLRASNPALVSSNLNLKG